MESPQDFLDRALPLLQRSDPFPKLLPQVRVGRVPKDSEALAAIISSWLDVFASVLREGRDLLDVSGARRLDPEPRIAVLVELGVLSLDSGGVKAVREAYEAALDAAQQRESIST